jgi:DNA-binding transcriptional LysR family regulator
MELRHFRYFVAVAEELHFGRAAKRLGISQPPVSQQIRALETEIGVELLRRTKRNVRLTPAGEVLLQAARKLLRGVEETMDVARRAARGEVGTVQIGYAPGIEIEILPKLLRAFAHRYPAVDVRILPLHTRDQLEALRQRRIDVGLIRLPAMADDLHIAEICREPLILVAPANHALAKRRTITFRDLEGVPYVHLARNYEPTYYDLILGLAQSAQVTLRVVAESSHLYDNLSLVAAGVGVTLLPTGVRRIRRDGVVYRPVGPRKVEVKTGLAYRKNELSQVPVMFIQLTRRLYPSS